MITFNETEMEVMRILWNGGSVKPGEIQEQFGWEIDNGTLRSTLVNLVRKKHVSRRRDGKAFLYSARTPKATALETLTRGLARIFAGGSTRELAAQLIDTTDITPEDLKTLRDVVAGGPPPKKK
jgi:BlaI family transcriptional regulator, penicillinase repressor